VNPEARARVLAAAPERCREHALLAPYVAYKVGGPADVLAEPETPDELGAVLRAAHGVGHPAFVLGGGTNLLIRDGGIRGVVIHLGKGFRTVRVEGALVAAGAAATMMQAASAAEKAGLGGLEFGYDIPGTVGGALQMNAGAHGSEVRDVLVEVLGFDRAGNPVRFEPADIRFAYRAATYPVPVVVYEGRFRLQPADPEAVAAKRKEFHAYRLRTQPKGRSVGSVFKNPPGDHAGRLIEVSGLKGRRVGGAVVSEKHANFFLNEGEATAADLEALIELVRGKVREDHGVVLETEVRIVGEPAPSGEGVAR